MRLENKVVLVTASTRGIGLACVKACAKEGATVYMGARNMEKAEETAKSATAAENNDTAHNDNPGDGNKDSEGREDIRNKA